MSSTLCVCQDQRRIQTILRTYEEKKRVSGFCYIGATVRTFSRTKKVHVIRIVRQNICCVYVLHRILPSWRKGNVVNT